MSWDTYYKMPISYRKWLIDRTATEIRKSSENGEKPMPKGSESLDSTLMGALGKRPNTPKGLQRF